MTIPQDSLIGMALSDALEESLALSYDEDGYQDTVEADHQYDQHGWLEREVEMAADVLSCFAEDAARFA